MEGNRCQVANHNYSEIIAICFNTQCQANRICCKKCLIDTHREHIDHWIEIDYLLNYIKFNSQQSSVTNPKVGQALKYLNKVQNHLMDLSKLIKLEIDKLSSSNLQEICQKIGDKYNILQQEEQIQLNSQKHNNLVQDMLEHFELNQGELITKYSYVDPLSEAYSFFRTQFKQTMENINSEFQFITQLDYQSLTNNFNYGSQFRFKSYILQQSQMINPQQFNENINIPKFKENQLLKGHTDKVFGVDICGKRNLLVSASKDKTVKLWNLQNNTLIFTYHNSGIVYEVVFSKQGNLLAYGGFGDNSIKLIDINDLKKDIISELSGHQDCIRRLVFSNDSKYLISASKDQTLKIWDVKLKKEVCQLNQMVEVRGVTINSNDTLVAANFNKEIKLWNFPNRELLCTQSAHVQGAGVSFSNDQKMLVSSGQDQFIQLWSLDKLSQGKLKLLRVIDATTKCIRTVLFSPCSKYIISISNWDSEIKIIDSQTGEVVQLLKYNQIKTDYHLAPVAISDDMQILAYGQDNNVSVNICFSTKCVGKRECCQICQNELHNNHADQLVDTDYILNFIKTESKGPVVLQAKINQKLQNLQKILIDLEDLSQLIREEMQKLSSIYVQKFCKDLGNKYNILKENAQALSNQDWNKLTEDILSNLYIKNCDILLKDATDSLSKSITNIRDKLKSFQTEVDSIENKEYFQNFKGPQVMEGHTDLVKGIDVCKQRNLLASGSSDKTVKLWSLGDNTLIKSYTTFEYVQDVVFSNQGDLLAFGGGDDCSIKLIDISDLNKDHIVNELCGHSGWITRLAFYNDSKCLISGSLDKTVRIWNLNTKKEAFQFKSEGHVLGVAISADDAVIASNSYDGKIRIWNLQEKKLLCSQPTYNAGLGIQFSRDQKMLVSSGYDGITKLWSLEVLKNQGKLFLIRQFKAATKCVWTVLFSPCSRFIIQICNQNREIKVLDSQTGHVLKLFKSNSTNNDFIVGLAISNYLDIIAYAVDNKIVVWRSNNEI